MVHGLDVLVALNMLAEIKEKARKQSRTDCGAEKCCGNPSSCETNREVIADLVDPEDECIIEGKRAKKVGGFFSGDCIFEMEDGTMAKVSGDTLVTKVDAEPVGYSPFDRKRLAELVGCRLRHQTFTGDGVATRLVTDHVGDSVKVGGQWVTAEELCRHWFLDAECKQPAGVLV